MQHLDLAAHLGDDLAERGERGGHAVELAAAVVGDDDAVRAGVDRAPRVVGAEDALGEHGAVERLAQPRRSRPT